MKKFAFGVIALSLLALAAPAEAQVRPFTIGIAGGPSFPTGELAEEAGTGYNVQGSLGFRLPLLPVGLRADALWQEFPDDQGGYFRQVGGLLNATLGIPLLLVNPYVLGGVGFLNTEAPEVGHGDHLHAGTDETAVGFNAGIGIEFPFLGLSGTAEARWLNLFGGGQDVRSIPVTIGIKF